MMNEGCATFVHYTIMNRLHEKGLITDGSLLEFLHSHTSVVFQPAFDDKRYSGINPYALGFSMMEDIKRIATDPTDEDRDWFPAIAGAGDPMEVLKDAWANYRDESFIEQFLSPKLMRDLRMFALHDQSDAGAYRVEAIHDDTGYRRLRSALARQYDVGFSEADIQVTGANLERRPQAFSRPPPPQGRSPPPRHARHGERAYRAALGPRGGAGRGRRRGLIPAVPYITVALTTAWRDAAPSRRRLPEPACW